MLLLLDWQGRSKRSSYHELYIVKFTVEVLQHKLRIICHRDSANWLCRLMYVPIHVEMQILLRAKFI